MLVKLTEGSSWVDIAGQCGGGARVLLDNVRAMEHADWASRWETGQIGFHQSDITDALERHAERVWGTGGLGRVFVPLCGKSLDLVFLAERAEEVVGVEYVEQAVQEFFAEQELAPEIVTGPPPSYRSGKYTLFAADIFDVGTADLGQVDAVFDRAALVALDAPTRRRYATYMGAVVAPGARTLLVTFDYDQDQMTGPPFAVSDTEVEQLFSADFDVEHLGTRDVLNEMFKARGLTAMTESAFALTRRVS